MPTKLTDPVEEQVRQFITDNIRPAEIEGYDPTQTDPTADDHLPVSSDYSQWGDAYPAVFVREGDGAGGPTVPNSGTTGYNGLQGDGSGVNQTAVYNVSVSVQAVKPAEDMTMYLNGVGAEELVFEIYQEIHQQVQQNAEDALSEALFVGLSPPTVVRDNETTDSGSTATWIQRSGTASVGVINEP